jgi:hypothetical protein
MVTFLHDLAGTISAVAHLVVVSATGIHDRLAPNANGRFALEAWNIGVRFGIWRKLDRSPLGAASLTISRNL